MLSNLIRTIFATNDNNKIHCFYNSEKLTEHKTIRIQAFLESRHRRGPPKPVNSEAKEQEEGEENGFER